VTDQGGRLTFDGDEQTERELRAAACSTFLTMSLQRREDHLVLDINGPQGAPVRHRKLFALRRSPAARAELARHVAQADR